MNRRRCLTGVWRNVTRANLESLIGAARQQGASDLHLEAGLGPALRTAGDPVPPTALMSFARDLIGEAHWSAFVERRSTDLSRTIQGVRCRLNIFHTARSIGMAIRLLASFQVTVETLNLHPDLKSLISHPHGLILVCGPTGSGKSSTLAALIQEINLTEMRHIATIENPINAHPAPSASHLPFHSSRPSAPVATHPTGRIEIEPVDEGFGKILKR